ncbi:MAG: hypothetical protein ACXIUM_02655 [Wenzhouxiangella sp.]
MGTCSRLATLPCTALAVSLMATAPMVEAQTFTEDTTLTEDFEFSQITIRGDATLTVAEGVNFRPTPGIELWRFFGQPVFVGSDSLLPTLVNQGNFLVDGALLQPDALGFFTSALQVFNDGEMRAINNALVTVQSQLDDRPFVNRGELLAASGSWIGFVGNGTPAIVNEAGAQVSADGGTIRLPPGFQNQGSIRAINDGVIELGSISPTNNQGREFGTAELLAIDASEGAIRLDSRLNLQGGSYAIPSGSELRLADNSRVRDGGINTGSGLLRVESGSAELDGVSVQGEVQIDGGRLALREQSSLAAEVRVRDGGQVDFQANQQLPIADLSLHFLDSGAAGFFDESVLTESTRIIVDGTPGESQHLVWFARNQGLIDIRDGIHLRMTGSSNSGGTIRLGEGSSLRLEQHRGGFGTLERNGASTVTMDTGWSLEGETVTIDANFGRIEFSGNLGNGTLNLEPDAEFIIAAQDATFSGLNLGGVIPLNGGEINFADVRVNGELQIRGGVILTLIEPNDSVPTIDYDIVINGGNLLVVPFTPNNPTDGPLRITADATISNTNGERFFLQGAGDEDGPVELLGTIDLTGAGNTSQFLILNPGSINAGTIIVRDGHRLDVGRSQYLVNIAGSRVGVDDGEIVAGAPHNGFFFEPGSELFGTGSLSILGTGVNVGGVLAPADGDRGGIGVLQFERGGLTLLETAELHFDIGANEPDQFDRLIVNGNLRLDGALRVNALPGFALGSYTLMSYSGTLTDEGLSIIDSPPGFDLSIEAGDGEVRLIVAEPPPDALFFDRFESEVGAPEGSGL